MLSDEEGNLLSAINSYRQAQGAPPLEKHDKASCLADEIADELEDKPCPANGIITVTPGSQPGLDNYRDLVKKCGIDMNTTQEGVILPVCVPNRVPTLVLTNYTQSAYAVYVNSSTYTGFGIGKDDDWTVVVLATNTSGGSFASGAAGCLSHGFSYMALFVLMILHFFLFVVQY